MNELREKLRGRLIGQGCGNFRLLEGGTLILYLRDLNPTGNPKGTFWLNCAWRLRRGGRLLVGSLDQPDQILDELNTRLVGQGIADVTVDDATKDLRLFFADELAIEGFSYFTDGELWELRGADGFRLGIGPKLAPFERYEVTDS